MSKRIRIWLLLLAGGCLLAFSSFLCYSAEAVNRIVINEVCSSNFSVICDENGNYSDYVELFNPTKVPVSITGLSLSDDGNHLKKCCLDSVIIPARGYALIWVDGTMEDRVGHASFRLSSEGEELYLSDGKGGIIDSVKLPALTYNTAFGREKDGADIWQRQTPTAGRTNEGAEFLPEICLEKPKYSVTGGFYEESFQLSMEAGEDEIIYYTLDGSRPGPDALRYEAPLEIRDISEEKNVLSARNDLTADMTYIPAYNVDKAVVVRAAAYTADGKRASKTVTETYFVGYQNKPLYNDFPVLSLTVDPSDLFDGQRGIYGNGNGLKNYEEAAGLVNGEAPSSYTDEDGNLIYRYMSTNAYNGGRPWEREVSLIYFDEEHKRVFSQDGGIRISGQSSRNAAQKSFNVYARDIYDEENTFFDNFFEGMEYDSVKLRNGGTDHDRSKIYDAFLQRLAQGRDVATQASVPCAVFLNGEYWGLYNIRERYREDYFWNHYGIREDNVWMIDSGAGSIGSWDAWENYDAMLRFVSENDMSVAENYEKADELLDLQSLIDFYCIQLYIDNTDVGFDKNIALWRSIQAGGGDCEDGKWRFMLYDLDGALDGADHNTFKESEWWKEDFNLMDEEIIKSLLENEEFKKRFIHTFVEIADENFAYERVHGALMQWKERYEDQAAASHRRFITQDAGTEEYETYIDYIDDFFKERRKYIMTYLEEEMRK